MLTKYYKNELLIIEELKSSMPFTLIVQNISINNAILKKNIGKGFTIVFSSDQVDLEVGNQITCELISDKQTINVKKAYVKSSGFDSEKRPFHKYEIAVQNFELNKSLPSLEYYCRKIIPIESDSIFKNIFYEQVFTGEKIRRRGLIKIQIQEFEFSIFTIKENDKSNLFIDSDQRMPVKIFQELSWSLLVGIGYFLGHLVQNEEFNFYYPSEEFLGFNAISYNILRDSIRTIYHPIDSNSYGWIQDHNVAKFYYDILKEVPSVQVSKLCSIVHLNSEIRAILLLIQEAMKSSLLSMPAGLSVALEGLTEFYYNNNQAKMNPIKDKFVFKELRHELLVLLETYKGRSEIENYSTLETKINELNSPLNSDKLRAPFTMLGIELSKLDEEIISYRNDFLHGNINLTAPKRKSKKSYSMDTFEVSLRLYTLLNCIILKMINYDGYILNHAKIQEKGIGKNFNEDYYRKI